MVPESRVWYRGALMSQLESPDPRRNEAGQEQHTLERVDLAEAYHALCDELSGQHAEVHDRASFRCVTALAARFRTSALENAAQDAGVHPERVPEKIPLREPRILSETHERYAFYAEMTNAASPREWLLFADLQWFRYAAGPVGMCVMTSRGEEASYAYHALFSEKAYREDLTRIAEHGISALYQEPGSFVLMCMKEKVEAQLREAGVDYVDFRTAALRRQGVREVLYLETSDGWFAGALARDPATGVVQCEPGRSGPPPEEGDRRSLDVAHIPSLGFDRHAMRSRYLALMGGYWEDARAADELDMGEQLDLHKLCTAMYEHFGEERLCKSGADLVFETPLVAVDETGVKWLTWLVYCVNEQGLTMFDDGHYGTPFQDGLVAYCAARRADGSGPITLSPLHDLYTFHEELRRIQTAGWHLLYGKPEVCELLRQVLAEAGEREGRGGALTYADVLRLEVDYSEHMASFDIETTKQRHTIDVEWNEGTGCLVFPEPLDGCEDSVEE